MPRDRGLRRFGRPAPSNPRPPRRSPPNGPAPRSTVRPAAAPHRDQPGASGPQAPGMQVGPVIQFLEHRLHPRAHGGSHPGYPLTTFDTVFTETPAACATSFKRDSATGPPLSTHRAKRPITPSAPGCPLDHLARRSLPAARDESDRIRRLRVIDDPALAVPLEDVAVTGAAAAEFVCSSGSGAATHGPSGPSQEA